MKRVLFTGGGSLGPVTPLLAVYEVLAARLGDEVVAEWIGTHGGPEKKLVEQVGIPFIAVQSGKLRRYFDVRNLFDPFFILLGFVQSLREIWRFRPDVVVSAGGFVAVPVLWAAWFLRKKSVILQFDVRKGLTNALTEFCATQIGVALPEEVADFNGKKTTLVGIPVRDAVVVAARDVRTHSERRAVLRLDSDLPLVVLMGGGTGALALNMFVQQALDTLLSQCQIVHLTGRGKVAAPILPTDFSDRYHAVELMGPELIDYLSAADLVVSRAGMGSLAELSVLGKASIVIPIPHSHQEENAAYFEQRKAVRYLSQTTMTAESLSREILSLLNDSVRRAEYERIIRTVLPSDAAQRVADMILSV